MSKYKQIRKWGLISTIIALIPLPLIGFIFYAYFLLPKNVLFFVMLPFILVLSITIYIFLLIGLSIIVYKLHAPLKEGIYSINSREMESWLASQMITRMINLVGLFQIPTSALNFLQKKIFKNKLGDLFIVGGYVEYALVSIGDNTIIGMNSIIVGHAIEQDKIHIKKIKIGKNCTIGANTIIMPGVTIGDGTIVGAASLVPKNKTLEPYSLYLGVPAKKIKELPRPKPHKV